MKTLEIVYTWEDGREEVRYRRPFPSKDVWKLLGEVRVLREKAVYGNYKSPYSFRFIEAEKTNNCEPVHENQIGVCRKCGKKLQIIRLDGTYECDVCGPRE